MTGDNLSKYFEGYQRKERDQGESFPKTNFFGFCPNFSKTFAVKELVIQVCPEIFNAEVRYTEFRSKSDFDTMKLEAPVEFSVGAICAFYIFTKPVEYPSFKGHVGPGHVIHPSGPGSGHPHTELTKIGSPAQKTFCCFIIDGSAYNRMGRLMDD